MRVTCWWEDGRRGAFTPDDHARMIALTLGAGEFYWPLTGRGLRPTGAHVPELFDTMRALEDRIATGEAFVARDPDHVEARTKLALLRQTYDAAWPTFYAALTEYEADPDRSALTDSVKG